MDKEFWASIAKNDYKVPNGERLDQLTQTLFSYLGSTDPELRDEIAYIVYANWLKRDMYTGDEIRAHLQTLLSNLEAGIGDTESDTVFLRAFSILLLAEIIHNDNKKSLLEKEDVKSILEKGLWYLDAEKDPRGYIPVKGWAHSLAHTADLFMVLGKHHHIAQAELSRMLTGIAEKIVQPNHYVYIHREDERLASAILEILQRDLLAYEDIEKWSNHFLQSGKFSSDGTYQEEIGHMYQNTRNLLRSVYLEVLGRNELPYKETLQHLLLNRLQTLQQL